MRPPEKSRLFKRNGFLRTPGSTRQHSATPSRAPPSCLRSCCWFFIARDMDGLPDELFQWILSIRMSTRGLYAPSFDLCQRLAASTCT
ncbi:uncharacterized protein LOC117654308 isoform X8 [Thrips palmi]|uniref:Uncharacterized protein LOC117654308 isoform X8 n=1 Tax=Thrips palmi TaxID=161013 RepID=A0A6P9AHD4_THRPL|nr:uncharacterized protein LOC117654308 isoform X8 [Thrips palmi]